MKRFSQAQTLYMAAKAAHEVAYAAAREYDKVMDAECEKLGIETPYGILPEGHPLWAQAQVLLDQENAASKLMYAAAHNLFDWAVESTLAKHGSAKQKADIRAMVVTVKKKAYVEDPFIKLVALSMKLAVSR